MYNYLLTVFKLIIGLITAQRLIYVSILAILFFICWISLSLTFSFQRRFNKNCVKLYNFIKKKGINANDNNFVDYKAGKISSGFVHGWKKFKSASFGKPSDYITRRDALDIEVSGGVLNQGKTLMRTFVNVATFALFVANFAYLGNNSTITFYLLAESMVLPLLVFLILKIFYFIYTSVKQQLYKADIECLYELLDLLDEVFVKDAKTMVQYSNVISQDEVADIQEDVNEVPELEINETEEIQTESDVPVADDAEDETKEENYASKYDFFKKKNIDVDKIMNSETKTFSSALPYINVDSDYVVKGDETAISKTINNLENGSELLGSMMQDLGSIKKIKKEEQKAESNEVKLEDAKQESQDSVIENEKVESEDPFGNLGQFEVEENALTQVDNDETEKADKVEELKESVEAVETKDVEETVQESEKTESEEDVKEETQKEEEEIKLEIPDVEPIEIQENKNDEVILEPQDDISEEKRENIASVVGGFKSKSKLASGGVIIERNQPISKREKSSTYSNDYGNSSDSYDNSKFKSNGITHLSVENNTDNILNTFRNSAGAYEDYQSYGSGMQNPMFGAGYTAPQYDSQGFNYSQSGFNQSQMVTDYGMQGFPNYQNVPPQGFDNYTDVDSGFAETDYGEDVDNVYEENSAPVKKPAVKRTKENEPRPRNLKKKESEPIVEELKTSKRGRPKKQVFDETVTIKNDKEFDEVLSRAEKLMKKSESGLSASQSKRIEKELKMLMDAMNKYKEGE